MTNGEKIRNLKTWGLAELLYNVSNGATRFTVCENECAKCGYTDGYCILKIAEWLMEEVKE